MALEITSAALAASFYFFDMRCTLQSRQTNSVFTFQLFNDLVVNDRQCKCALHLQQNDKPSHGQGSPFAVVDSIGQCSAEL